MCWRWRDGLGNASLFSRKGPPRRSSIVDFNSRVFRRTAVARRPFILGFFTNQSTISFNSRFFGFIPLGHAPRRFEAFPNLVGKPVPGAHSSRRRRADVSPEVSTLSATPQYVFPALSRTFLRAATARSGRNAERLRVENERDVLFGFRASARKKPAKCVRVGASGEAPRALERRPRAAADPVTCLEPSARVSRRPDDPSSPPPPFLILTDVSLPPFFIFREVRAQASGAASSLDMGGKVRANLAP